MSEINKYRELPVDKLRWECPESSFKFKTTAEIKPCEDIIGQDRALMSIKMGLDLEHRGYNIFITGMVGTGRKTTIKHLLERLERKDIFPRNGDFVAQRFLLFVDCDFELDIPDWDSWKKFTIFIYQKLCFPLPFLGKPEGGESVAAVSLIRVKEC